MQLIYDKQVCAKAPHVKTRGVFRVRIYRDAGRPTAVVSTRLRDDDGNLPTCPVEELADWLDDLAAEEELTWIDHTPAVVTGRGRVLVREAFDRARVIRSAGILVWQGWRVATRGEIEELIGQELRV
jgi:hypothetical protein